VTDVDQEKRKRGGQPKPAAARKRNNLTFRTRDDLRERLERAAERSNRSVSEEIEFRLLRDFGWEAAKGDIDAMRAESAVLVSAARVQALRAAGFQILREIEGKPTRAVVDLDSLFAESAGVARGLRSGFVPQDVPLPSDTPRPMTAKEENRVLKELEEIKRTLDEVMARTRANDEPDEAA
jgi:hypothetical protein